MLLHQLGCRKVVALMGSTMSAAQEEWIRKHTNQNSQAIPMLDEDDAGRAGREDIAVRLARFLFVEVAGATETRPFRPPASGGCKEYSRTQPGRRGRLNGRTGSGRSKGWSIVDHAGNKKT
jgi:hypothetical protein